MRLTDRPDSVKPVTGEPRIGDVFGEMLRDAYAVATGVGPRPLAGGRLPRPVIEIIERDDGLINGAPAAHYLDGPADWQPYDHRAVDRVRGATLDVGVGAGRIALLLQERGVPVTGLDTSAGALAVCRRRGVRDLVHGTVDAHVADGRRYDTFLLLGNNVGPAGGAGTRRRRCWPRSPRWPGREHRSSPTAPTRTAPGTRCTRATTSATGVGAGSVGSSGSDCATGNWAPSGSTTWSAPRTNWPSWSGAPAGG